MAKKKIETAVVTLAAIVAAGAEGLYALPAAVASLVADGLVETNPSMINEAGEIATRATQKGIESVTTPNAAPAPVAAKSAFALEDGLAIPAAAGRGRGGNTYPFDQMAVGQSFFVANTEKKPDAAKSLASTVSSATARYAVATGNKKTNRKGVEVAEMKAVRTFTVRAVDETAKGGGIGARVWRTA